MAIAVKPIDDLVKIIEGRLALALRMTQQEIYEVIQRHITDYYHEPVFRGKPVPFEYFRTSAFLDSLIKTSVETSGGSVSCKVKIDMGAMSYLQPPETVVNMINSGFHADPSLNDGDYETPHAIVAQGHFWDDAIAELGGEAGIFALMKSNCAKVGLNLQ